MQIYNICSHYEVNISNEKILSVKFLVVVIIVFISAIQVHIVQCKADVSFVAIFKI